MKKILFTFLVTVIFLAFFYVTKNKHQMIRSYCDFDMVYVSDFGGNFCIDKYEASQSDTIKKIDLNNDGDFDDFMGKYSGIIYDHKDYSYSKALKEENNLDFKKLDSSLVRESNVKVPVSKKSQEPWVLVTKYESDAYCKAADKRLPTNKEWYLAAQGTPDNNFLQPEKNSESCNVWNFGKDPSLPKGGLLSIGNMAKGSIKTGTAASCKSKYGAYDMVGNVWEWVSEVVLGDMDKGFLADDGKGDKVKWPDQGYITKYSDQLGIPLETSQDLENKKFNGDYTYTFADNNCSDKNIDGYGCNKKTAKIRGIMRGGSAVNGGAAGIYRADIDDAPSHSFNLLGFRCAKNPN